MTPEQQRALGPEIEAVSRRLYHPPSCGTGWRSKNADPECTCGALAALTLLIDAAIAVGARDELCGLPCLNPASTCWCESANHVDTPCKGKRLCETCEARAERTTPTELGAEREP